MRYSAFISYNHRDRKAASWLHRALETYRIPRLVQGREWVLGTIGSRLPPIFQDREELAASSDLAASVRDALEQAASLVVICSPNGAASHWVNEEIRAFAALGRRDRIQCLIVSGVPDAAKGGADPMLECFPPALFEEGAAEPLAADIRPGADDRTAAKLKLLAGILGVGYDELRQREHARRHRQMAAVAGFSAVGFLAMGGLAAVAVHQRDVARQKTLTAERTVAFVKSLFEVADPSEARGDKITAQEILDRGAQQLNQGLDTEPAVKAELITTLGEVYGGLGLLRKSNEMLSRGMEITVSDPAIRARQLTALGEAQFRADDYKAAATSHEQAIRLAREAEGEKSLIIGRNLAGLSAAQSRLGDFAGALRNATEALGRDMTAYGAESARVADDYKLIGEAQFFGGDMAAANTNVQRSLEIYLRTKGATHPEVADALNTLGNIAHIRGDAKAAERYFRDALAGYEAILGPDHPLVAGALNNVARMLLERAEFADAQPMLKRAVAIDLAQKDVMADDLVFEYANLGISARGLGHPAEADALFAKAEAAARVNRHRNLAPVLIERAEIACAANAVGRGLQLVDEARPIMAAAYPKDPWRSAWLEAVRGDCLVRGGQARAGASLLQMQAPVIRSRWSENSLYGKRLAHMLQRANVPRQVAVAK